MGWIHHLITGTIVWSFQSSFRAVSERFQNRSRAVHHWKSAYDVRNERSGKRFYGFRGVPEQFARPVENVFFLFLHRIIIKNERLQQSLPRLNILEPRTFFGGRRGGGRSLVTCSVARPYAVVVATQQVTQLITSAFVRFDETHQLKRWEVR